MDHTHACSYMKHNQIGLQHYTALFHGVTTTDIQRASAIRLAHAGFKLVAVKRYRRPTFSWCRFGWLTKTSVYPFTPHNSQPRNSKVALNSSQLTDCCLQPLLPFWIHRPTSGAANQLKVKVQRKSNEVSSASFRARILSEEWIKCALQLPRKSAYVKAYYDTCVRCRTS